MSRKISISIPTNRGFRPKTVFSLAQMLAYSQLDYHITIPTEGYNVAENRHYGVAHAIKNKCTHVLFSDDDMVYPPDALERLLAHDKDAIGVLYSVRRDPPAYVIEYANESENDQWAREQYEPFKVNAIGTGFLLVKTDVFSKIQRPFFGYKYYDNGMVKMSTDWFLCEKLRAANIEIWCDPTLRLKHIGEYEY